MRPVGLSLVVALTGCCPNHVAGDPKLPIELQLLFGDQSGHFAPQPEGAGIVLIRGGQGSQMVVLNAKARNLDSCGARLEGGFIEPNDTRVITTVTSSETIQDLNDGWLGIPDGDLMAALPLPINSPGPGTYTAVATVTDLKGRKFEQRQTFTLGCQAADTYCRCTILKRKDSDCP